LYGAIHKAAETLTDFKILHPKAQLRVLCFTDGEDTLKTIQPNICVKMMQANGIVLDAIMIGEGKDNHILRAMAKATGGYAFSPQTLTEALNLNELETLLSISERPKLEISVDEDPDLNVYADLKKYPLDICNREIVPSRKMPKELKNPVVTLEIAVEKGIKDVSMEVDTENESETQNMVEESTTENTPQNSVGNEKERLRRILKELRALLREPHPNFDIYPSVDNIGFWNIVMEVDEGSMYSHGTWLLYAEFPPNFPLPAPEIRFVTPIRHSNVNQYGKICHSIFTRNWTADTTIHTVLQCIYDTNLALSFFSATGDYEAAIMDHVEKTFTCCNV